MHTRVSIPNAAMIILDILSNDAPLSISALAKSAGLDRRTVMKTVNMILKIQDALLPNRLEMKKVGQASMVWLKEITADIKKIICLTAEKFGIKGKTE